MSYSYTIKYIKDENGVLQFDVSNLPLSITFPATIEVGSIDIANLNNDLWCVTSYFNPLQYKSKLDSFKTFYERMLSQKANLFVVECALPAHEFVLHNYVPANNLLQVNSENDAIWQKECLLNMGIDRLPHNCDKVAWLDCDVFFLDDKWITDTIEALKTHKIIQLFEHRYLLLKDNSLYTKEGDHLHGWVAQIAETGKYDGGHPGYAWAARRDLLKKHKLYDRCITGVGDFLMAAAACNTYKQLIGDHFFKWAEPFAADISGSIGYLKRPIFHIYHGPYEKRNYLEAVMRIGGSNFDPEKDLEYNENGCLMWADGRKDIQLMCLKQFIDRNEDE
jgi:hypothetical protein